MDSPFIRWIRERAGEPLSKKSTETLVCFALIVWVGGQLLFAYSTFGSHPVISRLELSAYHQAIAVGCLTAALAGRTLDLRPLSLAFLFVALFSTLTIWRRGSDVRPILLLLFVLAAQGGDLSRLARSYVLGALGALTVIVLLASIGKLTVNTSMVAGQLTSAYGFRNPARLSYLLLGILGSIALGWGKVADRPFVALCALVSSACFFVLHDGFVAVLALALGGCVLLADIRPALVFDIMDKQWVRWVVALLPLLLLGILNDGVKFYELPFPKGGYRSIVGTYGYLAPLCLVLPYVIAVFRLDHTREDFLRLALCTIAALAFIGSSLPVYLEYNCTLLILTLSMTTTGGWEAASDGSPHHDSGQGTQRPHGLERASGRSRTEKGAHYAGRSVVTNGREAGSGMPTSPADSKGGTYNEPA